MTFVGVVVLLRYIAMTICGLLGASIAFLVATEENHIRNDGFLFAIALLLLAILLK